MLSLLANFDQLIDEAIQIDNYLYKQRIEKGRMYATPYRGKEYYIKGDLIDLDTLYKGPLRLRYYSNRDKLLEKTERERYKRDRLYYNYRKFEYQTKEYKAKRLYIIEDNQANIIAKKVDTIIKTKGTSKALSIAQKKSKREIRRDTTSSIEKTTLSSTLKIKAINQNVFTKKAKLIIPKYIQDYTKEAKKQYKKLLQTAYFNDTYSIYCSNKKDSKQFP